MRSPSGATAFVIRPATRDDIPAVTAIYGEAVATGTASFELAPPDEAEMARRHAALIEAGYPYLAATRNCLLLGYGYAGPYRTRPAYRHTVEDSLYVAANARRQGIGGVLLRALIEASEGRGFRQMVAVIGDSGHAASIALHAAHGFRTVGTLTGVGYKHGRWLDSVLMQRALGDGIETPPAVRRVGPQASTSETGRSMTLSTRARSCPRRRIRPPAATSE